MNDSPDTLSMTGSEAGAPATHRSSVSIALGQLRRMVVACSTVLAVALLVQSLGWAWATWTDGRTTRLESGEPAPLVVLDEDQTRLSDPAALDPLGEQLVRPEVAADPNLVRSEIDRTVEISLSLAAAFGRLAVAALVPLVALGVLLAAGSATDGVEKTVTAFAWSIVTVFLVFPIAARFGMPWNEGALWQYSGLTAVLDGAERDAVSFWLQYLALPLATFCATVVTGMRFSSGVKAGLLRPENFALDLTLEREAGGRQAGSHYASRAARAMDEMQEATSAADAPAATAGVFVPGISMPPGQEPAVPLRPTGTDGAGPATEGGPMRTSSGEAPRRII